MVIKIKPPLCIKNSQADIKFKKAFKRMHTMFNNIDEILDDKGKSKFRKNNASLFWVLTEASYVHLFSMALSQTSDKCYFMQEIDIYKYKNKLRNDHVGFADLVILYPKEEPILVEAKYYKIGKRGNPLSMKHTSNEYFLEQIEKYKKNSDINLKKSKKFALEIKWITEKERTVIDNFEEKWNELIHPATTTPDIASLYYTDDPNSGQEEAIAILILGKFID